MKALPVPIPGQAVTLFTGGSDYESLPAVVFMHPQVGRTMYSRWRLSPVERLRVAWRGEIGMYQVIGGGQAHAQMMDTERPWVQAGVLNGIRLWLRAFGPWKGK